LIAWFIRLAASCIKLRRFGLSGKSDRGEYATGENRRRKAISRDSVAK
jgi:hypothetical protein